MAWRTSLLSKGLWATCIARKYIRPFHLLNPRGMFFSGQIIDRQIIDNIALARQQAATASRILANFLEHDLLDRNLRPQ
jgi:hypothetical protein